ncbi:MAG: bifunctional phosphopantothenoylcysteine decarboxylase/phosphopantothenate--cysteine ligase CoaBC, partial [Muribaculaceae bacterium]|nr:bifunctional phosphopantothenoylcysteine decarboxylase/phosphopantothenate--cysteine ligase CoaBC [Muribaculaceae bacterium]
MEQHGSPDILRGRHIVLGVTGGIAAYKSAILLRLLIKAGAEVQVVMTPAGKQMITPATMASLSGKPVVSEFFAANTGEWHSHVDLGLWADVMIVAPATACTIGKMASGVADNMLVTTYLSAKEHVMIAPAMDLDMWAHPSTQRNIATLRADGVEIIEPGSGELASHLVGKGRMAEPEEIFARVAAYLRRKQSMQGRRILVTAGPTFEDI